MDKDIINEVYFFGSLKDGFKSFPGSSSQRFSHYYNTNVKDRWTLTVRRKNRLVQYTYVLYGLLTSVGDGRTGSCFGISIEVENKYFYDLRKLILFFEKGVVDAMLNDPQSRILAIDKFGQIGFSTFNFSRISSYLQDWQLKIKEVLLNNPELKNCFKELSSYSQIENDKIFGFHPNTSLEVLNEYFQHYGGVNISESFKIEKMTLSELKYYDEKEKYRKESINRKRDNDLLKQKNEALKLENIKLKEDIKKQNAEISNLNKVIKAFRRKSKFPRQSRGFSSLKYLARLNRAIKNIKKNSEYDDIWKSISPFLILGVLLILALIISFCTFILTPDNKSTTRNNTHKNSGLNITPTVATKEDNKKTPSSPPPNNKKIVYYAAKTNDGRTKYLLDISHFLSSAHLNNVTVRNLDDFNNYLAEYLFKNSNKVAQWFENKSDLINYIKSKNKASMTNIESHIKINVELNVYKNGVPLKPDQYWPSTIGGRSNEFLIKF